MQKQNKITEEILKLTHNQVKELLTHLVEASLRTQVGNDGRSIFKKLSKTKIGRQKKIYLMLADCSILELYSIGRNLIATAKFPGVKKYQFDWMTIDESKHLTN